MIIRAILYPVVVALFMAGGLLAWFAGAGLLILAALLVLVLLAAIGDLLKVRRSRESQPPGAVLPPEETEEDQNPEAFGVRLTEERSPSRWGGWGGRWWR